MSANFNNSRNLFLVRKISGLKIRQFFWQISSLRESKKLECLLKHQLQCDDTQFKEKWESYWIVFWITKYRQSKLVTRIGASSFETANIFDINKGGGEHYNQWDFEFLQVTVMKAHLEVKSYKCNLCDYASVQAGHLKRHSKIHPSLSVTWFATLLRASGPKRKMENDGETFSNFLD